MSNNFNPWFMIGATIVGFVGAIGIVIAERFKQEQRQHMMTTNLARMDQQIVILKRQLEELQLKKPNHLKRRSRPRPRSPVSTEYGTAIDSSDQEFYDVSDDEVDAEDTVLQGIDKKLDSNIDDINDALTELLNLHRINSEDTDLLWRIGKAYHKICLKYNDNVEMKLEYVEKGLEKCKKGLDLNYNDGDCHKWYAILIGTRCDHESMRDRIKSSIEFKKHLDLAISLKKNDATLSHLLGRYCYEIANLNWFEKRAAAAISQTLPESSYEEALSYLENAESLGPNDWRDNKVAIAKCQIGLGNKTEALNWLEEALQITSDLVEGGEEGDKEVMTLIDKCRS